MYLCTNTKKRYNINNLNFEAKLFMSSNLLNYFLCKACACARRPPRMDALSHIPDQPWLCAAYVSGTCELGLDCSNQHSSLPYLWQVKLDDLGWVSLLEALMVKLEMAYCAPESVGCHLEVSLP